ncbi:MAG: DUF4350 domain-containing protein [Candidatus Binatia bacterium]
MTAQTYNRLTAILATGIFLIVSVLLASLSSRQSTDPLLRRPSTFFTDPSGARALFLIMQQMLPGVAQWRRPLSLLPPPETSEAPSTLVVAGPARPISATEAEHLERWLAAGGQLILLSADGWPLGPRVSSAAAERSPVADGGDAGPTATLLSRYAPSLRWTKAGQISTGRASGPSIPNGETTLGWRRSFAATGGAKVIAAANNAAMAVEIPVGQGRIVAVADPMMASNGALRRSDNAVWLTSLAAGWGHGRILFDEYHHGFGQKRGTAELTAAFLMTPWGWCVLQIAVAGLLYIFAYRRRFGRIRESPAPDRTSPLDLLDARAGVLQAAAAQGLAADLIVQHLCHNLTRTRSKNVDPANLNQEFANLAKTSAAPAAALQGLLKKVKNGERLSEREMIELGRSAGETFKGLRP